jgi:predicted ATPase
MATKGHSSVETEEAYVRGRELLKDLGDDPRQFAILNGLSICYVNQANLEKQLGVAEEMLNRAATSNDPTSSLIAHRVMAVAQVVRAQFSIAREHAEQAVALYDPVEHRDSARQYGHDQGVSTKWHLSMALMFLGFADASSQVEREASERAREIEHANTTAYDWYYTSFTSLVKRDWRRAQSVANAMIEDGAARLMPLWEVIGRHLLGSALAAQGESEAALEEIYRGREAASQLNHGWLKPMTLRFEAQALADLNRLDEAISCLENSLALVEATGERWWEAEIHHFYGELNQRCNCPQEQIEANFLRAIDIARKQEAKLYELRAATSLGWLWCDKGNHREAYDLIAPIYDWFTEGFDTADLKQAKALLRNLA